MQTHKFIETVKHIYSYHTGPRQTTLTRQVENKRIIIRWVNNMERKGTERALKWLISTTKIRCTHLHNTAKTSKTATADLSYFNGFGSL